MSIKKDIDIEKNMIDKSDKVKCDFAKWTSVYCVHLVVTVNYYF